MWASAAAPTATCVDSLFPPAVPVTQHLSFWFHRLSCDGVKHVQADTVVEITKKWNDSKSYMDFDSFRDRFQEMTMTYESVKEALSSGNVRCCPSCLCVL